MVNVMFISAWGPYPARAQAEIDASQAEPLLATGVAVLLVPNLDAYYAPEPIAEFAAGSAATPVAKRRKK